ncbi:MAG: ThiF family adenylyltransferase [Armatimonadetes bacterium]|nr:ThiF family adenylyltransferase [Armatimonadota bacterium]
MSFMDLADDLLRSAHPIAMPGGTSWRVISPGETASVADLHGLSRREAEREALRLEVIPVRYVRNVRKYGLSGQIRLLESSAVVFGLEGLGQRVAESLAVHGVGTLTLVDPFLDPGPGPESLRLAIEAPLVQGLAMVAANRALSLNSAIDVTGCEARLDAASLEVLLCGCSVAVDCLPARPARHRIASACQSMGIPVVHAAISDTQGWVTTVFPGDESLDSLGEELWPQEDDARPGRAIAGVAACQGEEAIRVLLGDGDLLRGRLLRVDAQRNAVEIKPIDGYEV